MMEVVKKEILKWLDAGVIYPISDSQWVSPIHEVPKKCGISVVENNKGKLIPTRVSNGWSVCIDYRKLNQATRKDHFPLPFIDQMLEKLAGQSFSVFWMVIPVTHKYLLLLKIKIKPLLLVLLVHLLLEECLLVHAMLLEHFKDA